jgi:adenylate cyclase
VKSRLLKAITLGSLTGLVGLCVSIIPFGFAFEENVGLDLLFSLRGMRQPPPDVIIVAINQKSANDLNLPKEPRKWPRSLHARLTENLSKEGAAVIAFDLIFSETKSSNEDSLFAEAIEKSRSVVLCEYLKEEKVPFVNKGGSFEGSLDIKRLIPPIPCLAKTALALAPFPLPKVPVKVSQYWTFKTEVGDMPTLPVVVYQIFAMNVYEDFIHLLEMATPSGAQKLPHDRCAIVNIRGLETVVQKIRGIFEDEPFIMERMLKELQNKGVPSLDPRRTQILKSLIKLYQHDSSSYLNFYGPPGTITTIPYSQILQLFKEGALKQKGMDLEGKAIFVGVSERIASEQKDGFHTVFSQPSGLDLSGVEIVATAFANLLEDKPVQPLHFGVHLAMIFIWGVIVGVICRWLPTLIAATTVIGLAVLYLTFSAFQFKASGSWYPVALPIFIQSPLAFFSTVVWRTIDANKERERISKALGFYLPDRAVRQLVKNIGDFKASFRANQERVYGICLHTDVKQYTSLSEPMDPEELGHLMNKYFEILFKPVIEHGGFVVDIKGDSILALWVNENPELASKRRACQAALNIAKDVNEFNRASGNLKLQTRIGLHSGNIMLGNIGAIDHYEYRPVGDAVNTSSRIENLNKHLETQILVSEDVIGQLDTFLTRDMGRLILAGKKKPLGIHELVCLLEESDERQRELCETFSSIVKTFRERFWTEAEKRLHETIERFGEDGPSLFYLDLCQKYRQSPPDESWDGVVSIAEK